MSEKDDYDFTKKDLYKELWKCRDLEIENLLKRSGFFTAFITGIGTAYCVFAFNTFFKASSILDTTFIPNVFNHLIAYLLTLVGIVFSILWVNLSKGSKYWFEVYQENLKDMCKKESFKKDYGDEKYPDRNNIVIDLKRDNRFFFSTLAHRYSPSRINIIIGFVFFIMFSILSAVHFGFILSLSFNFLETIYIIIISIIEGFVLDFILIKIFSFICEGSGR